MYRNCEGYADPTVGSAFAHMAYEERKKRRMAAQEQKKAAEAAAAIEALKKQESEKQLRLIRKKQRESYYNSLTWVKAWPKSEVTKAVGTGGNE